MTKSLNILIIEDSEDDAVLLLRELKKGGYEPLSERVETPDSMKAALEKGRWDIIISDYILPGFGGLAALDLLKQSGKDLPFIIVSGNIGEDIAVAAMKAGAHDYIIKGNLKRLVPAVERELRDAEVRRSRRRAEDNILQLNRLYSVLSKVNEAIVRVREPKELYEKICRIIVEEGAFRLAWVGLLEPVSREVRVAASFGESDYLEGIRIVAADVPEGRGPTGRAVSEDHYIVYTDFENDPRLQLWRDSARAHGLRSLAAFPLHTGGQVIGALTIYSDKPGFFNDEEVSLLISLSEDISFALDSIETEKKRSTAEDALHDLTEELRNLTVHLQEVREAERTSIARDIHDELGQIITALRMDLVWIKNTCKDDKALFSKSTAMLALVDSTIQSIQNIIASLRPGILDVLGIYAAIEWQAEELKKMTGISCDLMLPSEEVPISETISTNIFRIVQELFTNITRYAKATIVSLSLNRIDDNLVLSVSDNGVGIRPHDISNPTSFGIIGIRERVFAMGGDIKIAGSPGSGTSISITVPLQEAG
ncbi:MAG: response regulator [Nitrospiraceae bacterium]|nr:MAG: response regulator [Nitrospiraceae bacterium]